MMSLKRVFLAVAFFPLMIACSADDAPEETTRVSRDAICSNGDDGDSCVNDGSGCPASCGMCFTSIQQKLTLRNLAACDDPTGGSGGGGATSLCWGTFELADIQKSATMSSEPECEGRRPSLETEVRQAAHTACAQSKSRYCVGRVRSVVTVSRCDPASDPERNAWTASAVGTPQCEWATGQ
jgi:hypothetical protein